MNGNFENKDQYGRKELTKKIINNNARKKFFKDLITLIIIVSIFAGITIFVSYYNPDDWGTIKYQFRLFLGILGLDPIFLVCFILTIIHCFQLFRVISGNIEIVDDVIAEKIMDCTGDGNTPEFNFMYSGKQYCGEENFSHLIGEHFYLVGKILVNFSFQ